MRNEAVEKQIDSMMFGLTEEEAAFFNVPMPARQEEQKQSSAKKVYTEKMHKTYVIPTELVHAIDGFCKKHKMKKTQVLTLALEEFLEKHR